MKKIKVFETFAGIGAQHKALKRIFDNQDLLKKENIKNIDFEIVGTSEWYIDSIISYDIIHHKEQNSYHNYNQLDKFEMLNFIQKFTLSKDSKNVYDFNSIKKLSYEKIRQLYIALNRNKNFGSILDIKAIDLPKIDLLTYSFPCQDISSIGKGRGISKDNQLLEENKTRSGLLWEIERILFEMKKLNKLPKFLLMENVKALLQKKHLKDWMIFEKNVLEKLGYKNTTLILNSLDFGIPQNRERVFVISELNGTTNINVQFKGNYQGTIGDFLDWNNQTYINEWIKSIPNNTPSRKKTWEQNKQLYFSSPHVQTITTKQDRNPNCGNVYYPNKEYQTLPCGKTILKSQFRFITSRECLLLMGFDNIDFELLKSIKMNNEEILKQAGNSIVVNVLESIFLSIIKKF